MKQCRRCEVEKSKQEFYSDRRAKDGLRGHCKACHLKDAKEFKIANPHKSREWNHRYRAQEGYCVYRATYPSGIYIGSGVTKGRRNDHLNGSTGIGGKLKERALSFEVILKDTKESCLEAEELIIELYGIDNLLNTRRRT